MTTLPVPQTSDEQISVPHTLDDISAQWLCQALAERCDLGDATVASIDIEEIGVGRGYAGFTLRLTPVYDGQPVDAPASVVAKIPTFVELARESDRMLLNLLYTTEIHWYRDLAARCPVRVPSWYWGGMDPENGRFCLLLEDLGDLRTRNQLESCDAADARLAVTKLAKIHAAWWGDASLEDHSWMLGPDELGALGTQLWGLGWEPFKQFFEDDMTPEIVEIGGKIGQQMVALSQRSAASASTLVHGDYRLENFLFGSPDGDDDLCVLDWQLVSRGSGLRDLGYFIGQNLTADLRREIEDDLLRLYHATLGENGVKDYGFQQCYDDYRIGLLVALWVPVNGIRLLAEVEADQGGGQLSDEETLLLEQILESGGALMRVMAERNIAAVLENDAQAMLER